MKKSFNIAAKSFCGVLAGLFLWHFGFSVESFYYLGFFSALCWVAWVDWQSGYIYDRLTYPLILVGLPASLLFPTHYGMWWSSLAGAAASLFGVRLLARLGERLFGREALGGGDVKLAAAIGAFLGLAESWKGLLLGALLSLPLMLVFQWRRGLSLRAPAPFGPGLCLGAGLVMWNMLDHGKFQTLFDRLGL